MTSQSLETSVKNMSANNYYCADYEVIKDILALAYAQYGRTDLHSGNTGVGAGLVDNSDNRYWLY